MAVQTYQVILHYPLVWNIHLLQDRCFCEEVVISLWQQLIQGAKRTKTWKCHFFGALFFWFNWAWNRLSSGLKQNKSVVILCYLERSSDHWQMARVLYISLILQFSFINLTQPCGLHLVWVFSHGHSRKHSLQGYLSSAISLKCSHFSHHPNLRNKWNLTSWNALSTALNTEMVPILPNSAEQNPPNSFSSSWLQADCCCKMGVCEGKYFLNFFWCCSGQQHIFLHFKA